MPCAQSVKAGRARVGEGAGKGVLITKQGAAEPADFTATCLLGDIEIVAEESIRSVVRV